MINPILVILLAACILSVFVLCVFIRPKKPIFTGATLIVLILFVIFTAAIDNAIYSSDVMHDFEKGVVSFITATDIKDTLMLEKSFEIFSYIDIGLFALAIVSMCVELRAILISVYSDCKVTKSEETDKNSTDDEKAQK